MNTYRWLITNKLLQRFSDKASIPWPPAESEGFKAKKELDQGAVLIPQGQEWPN